MWSPQRRKACYKTHSALYGLIKRFSQETREAEDALEDVDTAIHVP